MLWLLCLINACNGYDTASTLWLVMSEEAVEFNPIMACLLSVGFIQFVIVKFLLVLGSSMYLVVHNRKTALEYLTLTYTLLVLWHMVGKML